MKMIMSGNDEYESLDNQPVVAEIGLMINGKQYFNHKLNVCDRGFRSVYRETFFYSDDSIVAYVYICMCSR